jgi:hypothetical protein
MTVVIANNIALAAVQYPETNRAYPLNAHTHNM